MTPREIVFEQIRHRETPEVPYTLPMEDTVRAKLDEYYGTAEWRGRLKDYIVGVSAVDTDPREVVDDTHAKDGYGGIWRIDMRPWHLEKPPLPGPSFEGYDLPPAESFFRPEEKKKAERTCEERSDCFIIGNLGWGLFERSWNIRGFENALMDAITDPDFYEELLDRLMNLYLAFVEYTADLPVDGILFGDDWGEQRGVILGPDRWRRFLKPRWAKIYEAVHARGKIAMSHCCGSVAEIMPDIIEMGLDVLESVQPEAAGMNSYELKKKWGDKITFWGCLGSQSIIPMGTPEEIRLEARKLKTEMSRGGGYILAPAKPLQPETPVENAAAVVEAFAGD
ncbi:MAG: uroporphyrinogen decarboxylase family protein [Kiritimatiellia bacterium]